jgi:hypothetical protein
LGLAGLAIDFFPDGRWFALETSCPRTPSTAIESVWAETLPACPHLGPEIHAIPRGFGRSALVNPNRRRRVRSPGEGAAGVYLSCQVRRFGLGLWWMGVRQMRRASSDLSIRRGNPENTEAPWPSRSVGNRKLDLCLRAPTFHPRPLSISLANRLRGGSRMKARNPYPSGSPVIETCSYRCQLEPQK